MKHITRLMHDCACPTNRGIRAAMKLDKSDNKLYNDCACSRESERRAFNDCAPNSSGANFYEDCAPDSSGANFYEDIVPTTGGDQDDLLKIKTPYGDVSIKK